MPLILIRLNRPLLDGAEAAGAQAFILEKLQAAAKERGISIPEPARLAVFPNNLTPNGNDFVPHTVKELLLTWSSPDRATALTERRNVLSAADAAGLDFKEGLTVGRAGS